MKIINLEKIDSTNEHLKRKYQTLPSRTCVIAKIQTAGKGRRGHLWQSHDYQNMTVSFLYKDIDDIQNAWKYTLIAAKSVVELLKQNQIYATIKWPNDVYVNDSKICGILVETILDSDLKGIIIGIGLNVNNANPYICMKDITGNYYDITELLLKLIICLNTNMDLYQNCHFIDILEYVNHYSYLKDKWVKYKEYGYVSFKRVTENGLVEFVDRKNNIYQEMMNVITLSADELI